MVLHGCVAGLDIFYLFFLACEVVVASGLGRDSLVELANEGNEGLGIDLLVL